MIATILVPLDQSSLAEEALGTAAALARKTNGVLGLVLAHEVSALDDYLDASRNDGRDPAESIYLRKISDELSRETRLTVNAAVKVGRPVDVICRRAHELGAGLIVMTSHGRTGISRAWMGSVADGVVREASVPVLVVRAKEPGEHPSRELATFTRILVPLDGSATSTAVLPIACEMARACGATLVLARVVLPVPLYIMDAGLPAYPSAMIDPEQTRLLGDSARDELSEIATRVEREQKVRIETEVVVGDSAARSIMDIAKARNVDLIAMTTHGRGVSRLVVGSVADKVIRGSELPLLLFHPNAVAVRHTEEEISHAVA